MLDMHLEYCTHLPDTCELAHLNVPAHGDTLSPDDVQALGI